MAKELSIFCDESGSKEPGSKYYLITLVFHEQDYDIEGNISNYEAALSQKKLPDVPFHASPLMNGHDEYEHLDMETRKKLLTTFAGFVRKLPIYYQSFSYLKKEFGSHEQLEVRMKRDLTSFLFDHIEHLQTFEAIKVYYDGGQKIVTRILHQAIEYVLSKEAIEYRKGDQTAYRLCQVADFFCTIELTSLKYNAKEATMTDEKIFGTIGSFKANYLENAKKKRYESA